MKAVSSHHEPTRESPHMRRCCLVVKSRLTLAAPWTVALQAPLSRGFSRQEHWNELPFPLPRGSSSPGTKALSPALAGGFFTPEPPGRPVFYTPYRNE